MIKKYDLIFKYKNVFSYVRLNDKYGIIDDVGKEVIECKYDNIRYFKKNFYNVKLNGEWFWINQDETIKIKTMKLL